MVIVAMEMVAMVISLTIVDPPKVTVRVTNRQSEEVNKFKVTEGSRVNMTCAVDANPPPIDGVRKWSKDGAVSVYQVTELLLGYSVKLGQV